MVLRAPLLLRLLDVVRIHAGERHFEDAVVAVFHGSGILAPTPPAALLELDGPPSLVKIPRRLLRRRRLQRLNPLRLH